MEVVLFEKLAAEELVFVGVCKLLMWRWEFGKFTVELSLFHG